MLHARLSLTLQCSCFKGKFLFSFTYAFTFTTGNKISGHQSRKIQQMMNPCFFLISIPLEYYIKVNKSNQVWLHGQWSMPVTVFYQGQCIKLKSYRNGKKAAKDINEPNPILPISKSTRLGQSHPAALNRSTDENPTRQLPAHQCQPPGGARRCNKRCRLKTQNADILGYFKFSEFPVYRTE